MVVMAFRARGLCLEIAIDVAILTCRFAVNVIEPQSHNTVVEIARPPAGVAGVAGGTHFGCWLSGRMTRAAGQIGMIWI
jgi:hypothetical protein